MVILCYFKDAKNFSSIMSNIIVTLTTIPSRLKSEHDLGIKSCVFSLLNQNYSPYEIHMNIPWVNKRTGEEYVIPKWLSDTSVKIFRTDDLGPGTKSIPTIERIVDPETIIIVVDDDLIYHEDMISEQVNNQQKHPEAVVGYDGLRSRNEDGSFSTYFGDSRDYWYNSHTQEKRVDILQHFKTVSYKRRYFEADFSTFVADNFFWNDDLLLSAYFASKKRDRIVTYHSSHVEYPSFDEWLIKGGVTNFPVKHHTNHETMEGCNLIRQNQEENECAWLYKHIDQGYVR